MCGFPLRPAWAEINLAAIGHNVRQFKNHLSPKTSIMAIVKADGYGHGAVEVARAAVAAGVSFLGVGLVEEAVQLRENGFDVPILILGFTPAEYAPYLCQYKLTPSVFTLEEADAFARAARNCAQTLAVHVAVDTGMGRVGCFPCEKADGFIAHLAALQGLVLQGIYTHFASADQSDKSFACWQLKRFNDLVHRLAAQGIHIPVKHTANSAASIDLPEAHFEMVRIGISLYGLYPSAEVERSAVALRPAMSLKARIIFTKDIPAGTGVSYGSTYVANRLERIATLPLGYGDGYPRKLSNVGQVLVRGKRAPIVGRVCMDQTMINVQDIGGVLAGEEAVLFGRQGKALLHVDEVAGWLDTINYELVTRISGRILRVYVWED